MGYDLRKEGSDLAHEFGLHVTRQVVLHEFKIFSTKVN
jgi:hypothetical protein